jgi:hypothetical protein
MHLFYQKRTVKQYAIIVKASFEEIAQEYVSQWKIMCMPNKMLQSC